MSKFNNNLQKFPIGSIFALVGCFCVEEPYYQITEFNQEAGVYTLRKIKHRWTCPVYTQPIKDEFEENEDVMQPDLFPLTIKCVHYRKNDVLSRKAPYKYRYRYSFCKDNGGFFHFAEVSENGEYGYDD